MMMTTIHEQSSSVLSIVAHAAAVIAHGLEHRHRRRRRTRRTNLGSMPGRIFRKRQRRLVQDVYNQLGDVYFWRAYQMKFGTFQRLAEVLHPAYIIAASGKKEHSRNYLPNGQISIHVRLACAVCWFAGGSVYDIMTTYEIGHTERHYQQRLVCC
jgi:hypothetical protein